MKSYRNVVSWEQKHKRHSTKKLRIENGVNGLRIEFSMAWYTPNLSLVLIQQGFSVSDWTLEEMNLY